MNCFDPRLITDESLKSITQLCKVSYYKDTYLLVLRVHSLTFWNPEMAIPITIVLNTR